MLCPRSPSQTRAWTIPAIPTCTRSASADAGLPTTTTAVSRIRRSIRGIRRTRRPTNRVDAADVSSRQHECYRCRTCSSARQPVAVQLLQRRTRAFHPAKRPVRRPSAKRSCFRPPCCRATRLTMASISTTNDCDRMITRELRPAAGQGLPDVVGRHSQGKMSFRRRHAKGSTATNE